MSFTILFGLLSLLILVVVFLVAYRMKGLSSALIATATAFLALAVLLLAFIGIIINTM